MRAPEGQEIYLFPSVSVPPPEGNQGDGTPYVSEQDGAEAGTPEPADTNVSTVPLSMVGTMQPASVGTLPLTLETVSLASVRALLTALGPRPRNQPMLERVWENQRIRLTRIYNSLTGTPVARFEI